MTFDPRVGWEYRDIPGNEGMLRGRSKELLRGLYVEKMQRENLLKETRGPHGFLFKGLTPEGHDYFAGHYRGEDFEGLRYYNVEIQGDPRVGVAPELVLQAMRYYSMEAGKAFSVCREGWQIPSSQIPMKEKIRYLIKFVAALLVEFLRVHPFANGNGHISRMIVVAMLGEFGLWPSGWDIDERPYGYGKCIGLYRDGDHAPLEMLIMRNFTTHS